MRRGQQRNEMNDSGYEKYANRHGYTHIHTQTQTNIHTYIHSVTYTHTQKYSDANTYLFTFEKVLY